MNAHNQALLDDFIANKPSLEIICTIATKTIQDCLKQNGILAEGVESRVKAEKSLAGKLDLKGYKYNYITDLTDLVGVRIITFYTSEVDKIASLMEQVFEIDWENSVDKRKVLDSDRFGYLSLHYIARIPKSLFSDPAHPEINEFRFEIQMRTALQHVWATAHHDTGYKSDVEIPKEYIRALNRLAGVLEIADQEFNSIINELASYRRKVQTLVKNGNFNDLSIDGDTFQSYLELRPFDALNERIASINHAEIEPQNLMPYIKVLRTLGFNTLGELEQLKKDCEDDAYRLAALQIGSTDLDIIAESVGIRNLCIVWLVKNGYGEAGIRNFFDTLYGPRSRNASMAKRIAEQTEKLKLS